VYDKYKRKFDNDLTNPLRSLEEMTFHSINENRYIKAIKSELTKSGIADFDETEETTVEMKLKEEFRTHPYYEKGGILVNKRVPKDKSDIDGIKSYIPNFRAKNPTITLTNSTILTTGFEDTEPSNSVNLTASTLKMSDISPLTVRSAINKIEFFYFANLKKQFPKLHSITEFITSQKYLGGIEWTVYSESKEPNISEYEKRKAVISLLEEIKKGILKNACDFEGTKEFCPEPIKGKITDKKIKVKPKPNGEGMKRKTPPLWLDKVDWYVYDENYGTNEEMDFVAFFDTQYASLCEKYEDIKLIRNERAYCIYSFDDNGQRFEPDFILLMREKKSKTLLQVFIEPKGGHLLEIDAWKERFLLSLDKAEECKEKAGLLVDDESFKVVGLPFYNKEKENEFAASFSAKL
jgi:type III restriction enzyme